MIKLSRMADYAVVIMSAIDNNKILSTSDVAKITYISETTVSKILKLLTNANLLISYRGLYGGYKLAVSANNISVANIVSAIDGPISITRCNKNEDCAIEHNCPTRSGWNKVNDAIKNVLETVSLKEINDPE